MARELYCQNGRLFGWHYPVTAKGRTIFNSFGVAVAAALHEDDVENVVKLLNLGAQAVLEGYGE